MLADLHAFQMQGSALSCLVAGDLFTCTKLLRATAPSVTCSRTVDACMQYDASSFWPCYSQIVKLAGLEVYLSNAEKPLPGAPAIVLIHDIFGWEGKNVRLYADKMAQQGACF